MNSEEYVKLSRDLNLLSKEYDSLLKLCASQHGQIVQLQGCCQALLNKLCAFAPANGETSDSVRKEIQKHIQAYTQTELEELEKRDPELAAIADLRSIEDLFDNF